jgi:hypothetical protein
MPNTSTLPQDPGPYSAIFDYKAEAAKEDAKNIQLQENQKKIMRTNAIGDAFRLLIDGVGGSQGASITPKGINPGINAASSRLTTLGKERDSNLERLRLTDMANKTRDIAYNQQLAETSRANQLKLDEETRKRGYTVSDNADARAEKVLDDKTKRDQQLTDQETTQKNRLLAQDNSAKNTRETQAEYQRNLLASFNKARDRSIRTAKEDVEFIIPGTAQHIYISPAEILEMQSQLIGNKKKFDPSLDAALKDLMRNDPVKQESALLTLKKNWSTVKSVLGYPEDVMPNRVNSSPLLPGSQPNTPYQKGTGPLNSYGTPGSTAPPAATKVAPIKPDKNGITDVSSIFN